MTTLNNRPEMRVMIVGNAGKGKSSLGNSLLGSKKFNVTASSSFGDTHGTASSLSRNYGMVQLPDRTSLAVVDTPGLLDDNLYSTNQIGSYLELISPGPHAVLFVVRIGRFTEGEMNTFRQFVDIFGEDVLNYLIVVFTGKDDLEEDGETLQEFLEDVPEGLRKLLKDCKGRYAAINNRAKGDDLRKDVDGIIDLIRKTVHQNRDNFYSMEMFKHAQAIFRENIRKVGRKMKSMKSDDKPKKRDNGSFITVRRVALVAFSMFVIWSCYKLYHLNF